MVAVLFPSVAIWAGLALAGIALFILLAVVVVRALLRRAQPPPSIVDQRFWAFYQINDRLYQDPNRKRLSWSQERFRPHRFRWQSAP